MPAGIQAEADQKSEAQLRREYAKAQLDADAEEHNEHEPSLSGTTAIEGDETLRPSEDTAQASSLDAERES